MYVSLRYKQWEKGEGKPGRREKRQRGRQIKKKREQGREREGGRIKKIEMENYEIEGVQSAFAIGDCDVYVRQLFS